MVSKKIHIKNGKIWTGKEFLQGDVVADNGKIIHLGGKYTGDSEFAFDAEGAVITPGLVDIHMHMQNISTHIFGTPAESSCFPFGVTAAADAAAINESADYISKLSVKSSVFVCVDVKDNHADFAGTERLLKHYGDWAIGVKVFFDTSDTNIKDGTPLREICEFSKERGLKVTVHTANSPISAEEIVSILNKGDIFTHIFHGGVNKIVENDFVAFRKAREKGVIMDAGMAGGVHTNFEVATECIKNGFLPDTISTDLTSSSAFMRGGRYGITQCLSMLRYMGMQEQDILKCVTTSAAAAIGKSGKVGELSLGGNADIAVIKYCDEGFDISDRYGHTIKSDCGYKCLLTVVDGCVMYKD